MIIEGVLTPFQKIKKIKIKQSSLVSSDLRLLQSRHKKPFTVIPELTGKGGGDGRPKRSMRRAGAAKALIKIHVKKSMYLLLIKALQLDTLA